MLVGPFGIPAPFLVIAAATVLAMPFVVRNARVPRRRSRRSSASPSTCCGSAPSPAPCCWACAVFLMIGAFDALWAVVLDDLDTNEWIANLGITLFAVPLVVFGAAGGRLAQRVGPFRVGTVGLLLGAAVHDALRAGADGVAMFAVAMVHAVSDGLTVSSTGVAVGMVVPAERQAGAQGVLGGFQTLVAGVTAAVAGCLYEHAGRTTAYAVNAALMVVMVGVGRLLARSAWNLRGGPVDGADAGVVVVDPVLP